MDGMGRRLCRRCAGIDEDYTCGRSGTEWKLVSGLCEWCQLSDVLNELLVGDVDLQALRTRLLEAARPDRIVIWLYADHARDLLRGLSSGAVSLTHAALDEFANRPAADHVRGLLVAVGLLPAREEGLARFDRGWPSILPIMRPRRTT